MTRSALLDDTPVTAAGTPDLRQGGNPALGVAVADPDHGLGPEPVAAKLRNALMIVQAAGQRLLAVANFGAAPGTEPMEFGYRASDVEDIRRLVAGAIEQAEREALEHRQTRRNLELALARVRRLEVGPRFAPMTKVGA